MNKLILFAAAPLLFMGLAASCTKSAEADVQSTDEIVLGVGDGTMELDVQTKATTAISSLPSSLYISMTTGTLGSSEKSKLASVSKNVSSNCITTGIYQTATPTTYNYYVSNKAISYAASGSSIVATNDTDVIAGKVSSDSAAPSVTLEHVFARTGKLTLNTQTGYTLSGVSWSIASSTGGTAGTYNIATKTWSQLTKLASTSITDTSDMYLVPGNYTIKVTYTLAKGDWTKAFTKSASVTLVGGKINNISGTASGGSASEITLSLTLTPWGSNDITATFN